MDAQNYRVGDYLQILALHLMNHFLVFSLPALILFLGEDFDLTYTQAGLLMTIVAVTTALSSVGTGLLSDYYRRGRYPLIYIGMFFDSGKSNLLFT